MELKGIEGTATLNDADITFVFKGIVALADKKRVSPHVIPFVNILAIDFSAPTGWKAGHLRIVTVENQIHPSAMADPFLLRLGAGRRVGEVGQFVEQLTAKVDLAEYELPIGSPSSDSTQFEAGTHLPAVQSSSTLAKNDSAKPSVWERMSESADRHKFDGVCAGIRINGDRIKQGSRSWPVAECEALVDQGANLQARVTATRVLLTGPFALALKKGRNKVYLSITVPDDVLLVELKAKQEGDARKFAIAVNKAAAHFTALQSQQVRSPQQTKVEASANRPPATSPPQPPSVPAGWYPEGNLQRYWDGTRWTENTAPLATSE